MLNMPLPGKAAKCSFVLWLYDLFRRHLSFPKTSRLSWCMPVSKMFVFSFPSRFTGGEAFQGLLLDVCVPLLDVVFYWRPEKRECELHPRPQCVPAHFPCVRTEMTPGESSTRFLSESDCPPALPLLPSSLPTFLYPSCRRGTSCLDGDSSQCRRTKHSIWLVAHTHAHTGTEVAAQKNSVTQIVTADAPPPPLQAKMSLVAALLTRPKIICR